MPAVGCVAAIFDLSCTPYTPFVLLQKRCLVTPKPIRQLLLLL